MSQALDKDELADRFAYRQLTPDQLSRVTDLRRAFGALAEQIRSASPSSREQSLAFTHLETAALFAIKAISRET